MSVNTFTIVTSHLILNSKKIFINETVIPRRCMRRGSDQILRLMLIKKRLTACRKLSLVALQTRRDPALTVRDPLAEFFGVSHADLMEFSSLFPHHCHMVLACLAELRLMALQTGPDPSAARLDTLTEFFHIGLAYSFVHSFILGEADHCGQEQGRQHGAD
jgi:hypothetical protein